MALAVHASSLQEALKVILRQFVPLNNTVIYNGVHERQTAVQL